MQKTSQCIEKYENISLDNPLGVRNNGARLSSSWLLPDSGGGLQP